jgi:SAM-dependent methyltransferase
MEAKSDANAGELREFYEKDYARGEALTRVPPDGDFMYGQVLAQLRTHLRPEMSALDLGCNDGALSLYLARRVHHVLGIDLARNAVEIARRSAELNQIANATFQCLDFLKEWKEAAAFDFVLCSHVVEHVPDDAAFVRQIALALKPGGVLVLLAPAQHSSLARISRLFTGRFAHDEQVGHLRRYTLASLGKLAADASLTVERTAYLDGALRDWFILCRVLRPFNTIWCRPVIRRMFNGFDALTARVAFPATVCVHARKKTA